MYRLRISQSKVCFVFVLLSFSLIAAERDALAQSKNEVTFGAGQGRLLAKFGGQTIATYVYDDPKILRPYLMDVKAPGGIQVTRRHPPSRGIDPDDHATMHPGLWLAFGDISGSDFWRNKARVVHKDFVEAPRGGKGRGGFTVRNHYLAKGNVICEEICRITVLVRPVGYLILWDSTFSSDKEPFYFGDQEEMGLGVRVATPIMVKSGKGGRIVDDKGRRNEKQIWGKEALWCDYGGPIDGRFVGVTIMPDPDNFRPCRWHVRDYGFMAANSFGWKAFGAGDSSKIRVATNQKLSLRYGILLHSATDDKAIYLHAAYRDYLQARKQK